MTTSTNWHDLKPLEIEERSFQIIGEELKATLAERGLPAVPEERLPILNRVIHTSADFDYAENLYFSDTAVEVGLAAIEAGATIITDTNMAFSGVNKRTLAKFGGSAACYMADEDVAAEAKARGVTRAAVSMEKACNAEGPLIIAAGNAPTALLRLVELMEEGRIKPDLVIGVPVGFVNVVESKEEVIASGVPCIVARGRKGGSNIAACICNALIYEAAKRKGWSR